MNPTGRKYAAEYQTSSPSFNDTPQIPRSYAFEPPPAYCARADHVPANAFDESVVTVPPSWLTWSNSVNVPLSIPALRGTTTASAGDATTNTKDRMDRMDRRRGKAREGAEVIDMASV